LDNYHDSWATRKLIYGYDTFLESLTTICDMGSGNGADIQWWANLESKDDSPQPYNYKCFAVDKDQARLDSFPDHKNIKKINKDFTKERILPTDIDLLWSHDSLQYSHNPLETLRLWNEQMSLNGMMVLHVPQSNGVHNGKYYAHNESGCYFNYTPVSLIYMLAVNGFDCNDFYLLKAWQDPWIKIAVYKSDIKPMDPQTTTWYDLADKELLHPSIVASINRRGYPLQEEIITPWFDRENYYIDWVMPPTDLTQFESDAPATVVGKKETVIKSKAKPKVKQPPKQDKSQRLLEPVGIKRAPKGQTFTKKAK
jgi:hypothetical protein